VTEDICVPELEKVSGLKFNVDFFAGYSPERINPGDKEHTVTKILKVTSGSTPEIADKVDNLYKSIILAGTHKASSIKVAEASKVIENTQRDVNIALINELSLIFNTMSINTSEVIAAAATKWNFIKLMPGLVGGHCIGVDPYYLTYKAEELGYKPNLILGARQINNGMAKYIAERTIKLMIKKGIQIKDSKVLVLGITFKENCPDARNTKVIDIINEMKEYGCFVDVSDYWADKNEVKHEYGLSLINKYNLEQVDYEYVKKSIGLGNRSSASSILIDARPALKYQKGTIPSSYNIPDTNFDEYYKAISDIPKDKELIVFCGGYSCEKSPIVAQKLKENKKKYKNEQHSLLYSSRGAKDAPRQT
jgi:UDP-N-acetyl-D-galactosamine dehydrogenase